MQGKLDFHHPIVVPRIAEGGAKIAGVKTAFRDHRVVGGADDAERTRLNRRFDGARLHEIMHRRSENRTCDVRIGRRAGHLVQQAGIVQLVRPQHGRERVARDSQRRKGWIDFRRESHGTVFPGKLVPLERLDLFARRHTIAFRTERNFILASERRQRKRSVPAARRENRRWETRPRKQLTCLPAFVRWPAPVAAWRRAAGR